MYPLDTSFKLRSTPLAQSPNVKQPSPQEPSDQPGHKTTPSHPVYRYTPPLGRPSPITISPAHPTHCLTHRYRSCTVGCRLNLFKLMAHPIHHPSMRLERRSCTAVAYVIHSRLPIPLRHTPVSHQIQHLLSIRYMVQKAHCGIVGGRWTASAQCAAESGTSWKRLACGG